MRHADGKGWGELVDGELVLEEATDSEYRNVKKDIELVQQSLVDDGKFWLDKGEFELTIK